MLKAKEMKEITDLVVAEKHCDRSILAFDEIEKLIQYKAESGETCLYCSIEKLINQENLSSKEKE